jgi:glucose-1-phosphate thymidylyltransferase
MSRVWGVAMLGSTPGHTDSLLEASNFILSIEVRQGVKIGCLEEIALHNDWIKLADVERIIAALKSSTYARYLERVARELSVAHVSKHSNP